MRNRAVRSELKTYVKKVHAAVEAGDVEAAQAAANAACKKLDRAAAKGIIHRTRPPTASPASRSSSTPPEVELLL